MLCTTFANVEISYARKKNLLSINRSIMLDKFTLCLLDRVPVLPVGRVNTKPYSNFREFYR